MWGHEASRVGSSSSGSKSGLSLGGSVLKILELICNRKKYMLVESFLCFHRPRRGRYCLYLTMTQSNTSLKKQTNNSNLTFALHFPKANENIKKVTDGFITVYICSYIWAYLHFFFRTTQRKFLLPPSEAWFLTTWCHELKLCIRHEIQHNWLWVRHGSSHMEGKQSQKCIWL